MERLLWPQGNPNGWTRPDAERTERAKDGDFDLTFNVSSPRLTVYHGSDPDAPTVVVLPGGGYQVLAIEHEGAEVAAWLNAQGLNAAVLKYRLPNEEDVRHAPALEDVQETLRALPGRVGLLGFSAGGHLAAVASNAPEGPRPAFTVLVYPAYLDDPAVAVRADTPPAFLVHAADDPIPCANSLGYAGACATAGVPVELHLFPKGGHGYGFRSKEPGLAGWTDLLAAWLKRLG